MWYLELCRKGKKSQLSYEEQNALSADLSNWVQDLKAKDQSLKGAKRPASAAVGTARPSATVTTVSQKEQVKNTDVSNKPASQGSAATRIKSSDYRSWDKFDVEKQLTELDKELNKSKDSEKTKINMPKVHVDTQVKVSKNATEQELAYLANIEKIKGNDAYKSGDNDEAIAYYTRSLNIHPLAAVHCNRSLIFLKRKQYEEAEQDATGTFISYLT